MSGLGVLAGQVGYGKTAIILALVDKELEKAKDFAKTPCAEGNPNSCAEDLGQKFFDKKKFYVVVLETMTHLNKTSIEGCLRFLQRIQATPQEPYLASMELVSLLLSQGRVRASSQA